MPDTPTTSVAPRPLTGLTEQRGHQPLPSRDPRPAARLLVDAIQQVPGQRYDWAGIDGDDLVRASLQHGVTPALAVHLRGREDAPAPLVERLQGCYRDQLARHLRTLADLRRLADILNESSFRWAVMKGPALAEGLWPRPDLRLYVDLDILVERQRLGEAVALLQAKGAQLVDRNWPFILERRQGELSLQMPFGTPLDLHWHLVNDPQMRQVFTFPVDEVLHRAAPARLGKVVAPVLDPVDTVLHLAYHMVHSGGHRLVWLRDFDLALSAPDLDWDELHRRAARYGCRQALAVSVQRTQRVLRPSDPYPLAEAGGAWSRVASLADRWRPVPKLPEERGSGRIVFQATRDALRTSLRELVQDGLHRRGFEDPGTPGSNPLHKDVDDPAARERYFSLVAGAVAP